MWRWVTLENFKFDSCCSLPSPAICTANIGRECARLLLDVQGCSWMWGSSTGRCGPTPDTMCAKAIPTPQIGGLEELQSCTQVLSTRFYMLGFAKILKFFGPLTHLQFLDRTCVITGSFRNEFTSMCCEEEESEMYISVSHCIPSW